MPAPDQPLYANDHGPRIQPVPAVLDAVTMVSNPRRYESRYRLYRDFEQRMVDAGVRLTTVEVAFGDRPFEITDPSNPRHVQLRTGHELWIKESALRLGIARLPADWEYVAWLDADIQFTRPDWASETVHQLQHHPIVQMWSDAYDLGPHYQPLQHHRSFAWCYREGLPTHECHGHYHPKKRLNINHWHPGFAWSMRRDAYDAVGGLIDWAICGAGDRHMAMATIGYGAQSCDPHIHPRYLALVLAWQARAQRVFKQDLGCVDGLILHAWHGKKRDRHYQSRWSILVRNQYNPESDLLTDSQGLWQLVTDTPRQWRLRDELRRYLQSRNEDSVDLE
jgi:hypothetical protein